MIETILQDVQFALRTARKSGLDDEQTRNMLAGNANRIADGLAPLEPSAPRLLKPLRWSFRSAPVEVAKHD